MTQPSSNLSIDAHADRACRRFHERFGYEPAWVVTAPGRVNLIGEHTDYNGGFVLPMAIERRMVIAGGRSRHDTVARVYSADLDDTTELAIDDSLRRGEPAWSNYIRGVIVGALGCGIELRGFDALLDSTIPLGGGLSSSAALEVAVVTLVEVMADRALDPMMKVMLCNRAEHEFAGTPCGIMDQYTSVMGRAGHLLLLDCQSRASRPVPLNDPAVTVLIADTCVKHELSTERSPYAERRAQCEKVAKAIGVEQLRDATLDDLNAAGDRLDDLHRRRAAHVISEIARTLQAAEAIERRDWPAAGRLMYESHGSLRDDYQVSCAELDLMVELTASLGEESGGGVFGSRMTGGGFGGCTVSLVRTDAAERVANSLRQDYQRRTGIEPAIFTTRAADGAAVLEPPAAPHRPATQFKTSSTR